MQFANGGNFMPHIPVHSCFEHINRQLYTETLSSYHWCIPQLCCKHPGIYTRSGIRQVRLDVSQPKFYIESSPLCWILSTWQCLQLGCSSNWFQTGRHGRFVVWGLLGGCSPWLFCHCHWSPVTCTWWDFWEIHGYPVPRYQSLQ